MAVLPHRQPQTTFQIHSLVAVVASAFIIEPNFTGAILPAAREQSPASIAP
jgi:hypothetical protein